MNMLLNNFKPIFQDRMLNLLWSQWTAFGVAGHGKEWKGTPIDPEALLLTTCTISRYDARLFDAMLEWMENNGKYINVQRLKKIITTENFHGEHIFRAVAATVKNSVSVNKWRQSTNIILETKDPIPLFYLKGGKPMPIVGGHDAIFAKYGLQRNQFEPRRIAKKFPPRSTANLILRLRSLFGINVRCEIMANLLLKGPGSPRLLARETYYFPATISKTLDEMRDSGFIISRKEGRRRYHKLTPEAWHKLFLGDTTPEWIVWPRIFSALENIWCFLIDETIYDKSALTQASALRRILLSSTIDNIDTCGLDFTFGDIAHYPGEQLIPLFIERTEALLNILSQ